MLFGQRRWGLDSRSIEPRTMPESIVVRAGLQTEARLRFGPTAMAGAYS